MDRVEIKSLAKEKIEGKRWVLWQAFLVVMAVYILFSAIQMIFGIEDNTTGAYVYEIVYTLIAAPITVGLMKYCLDVSRGNKFNLKDLFMSFKNILPIIATAILAYIFISIGFCLLIVPGIIVGIGLSQVYYLLADGEDDPIGAIKKSWNMLKGYKWNYFVFALSWLGWLILSCLTFGILLIWVYPYMAMSYVIYYEKLLEKQKVVETKPTQKKEPAKKKTTAKK